MQNLAQSEAEKAFLLSGCEGKKKDGKIDLRTYVRSIETLFKMREKGAITDLEYDYLKKRFDQEMGSEVYMEA